VYVAPYRFAGGQWQLDGEILLARPEQVSVPAGWALAGNALHIHAERLPHAQMRLEAAPNALAMLRIAPTLLAAGLATDAAHAMPLYIRDKVAQTIEERAAARAAKTS